MDPKYQVPRPAEITAQANEVCARNKQREYNDDYQKSLVAVTKQLRDVEGHDMSKTMKEQIRQWFIECRWGWNADGLSMVWSLLRQILFYIQSNQISQIELLSFVYFVL